ncbi:MAG: SurA N-terminal domain-containing protein [Cyclobacteriaceae bacterium]|nr:SurA N-terminal domain-containing protein [Cyclobacteriaceae bacterium SS2]
MGKIVVGVVAFSMVAFILADFLQSGSGLIGNDNEIGEIAGQDITYEEFQRKVDELSYVFAVNQNRNPLTEDLAMIREQAWNKLILEKAYYPQFDKLGITVTDAEAVDMVQGNNINPQIRQTFTDPNTGLFQRENITRYLSTVNQDPQQRAAWLSFENTLTPIRRMTKYESLLDKTNYVTKAEAKAAYEEQMTNVSVEYFYVPFYSIPDSTVSVSRTEMEGYLNAHKDEYQLEESRSINYVLFPIEPSAADTAFMLREIIALKRGLENAQNDSTYASINSDGFQPYTVINDPELLPEPLKGLEKGAVTEPQIVNGQYQIYKLSEFGDGDEYYSNVSHILLPKQGQTEEAKQNTLLMAEGIIEQLNNGADFATLAAMNSADQSNSQNGGLIGWVGESSQLVQPFKDAVFAFEGIGLIPEPVETQFGYHIIQVNEPKTTQVIKYARIVKDFFASDETLNEIYRKADLLSVNSTDVASFKATAESSGYTVRNAAGLGKNDTRVGTISDARSVVLWLYNDASVGEVSEVFELGNYYMTAVMTGKQDKGTAKLDAIANEIEAKVRNTKKAQIIKDKIADIVGDDFEAMKDVYGSDARSGEADLTLSSNSFTGIGFAPEAVGIAFSLNEGEKTNPFEVTNGVLMIRSITKSVPEELEDYSTYLAQVQAARQAQKEIVSNFPLTFSPLFISDRLHKAVTDFAEITDLRYKFF